MSKMPDFPDGSCLIEAINGKMYRIAHGSTQVTMLIAINETVLLNVSVFSQTVTILTKDQEGIFRYAGDFSFSSMNDSDTFHFHGTRLSELKLNDSFMLSNDENNTANISFKIDRENSSLDHLKSSK